MANPEHLQILQQGVEAWNQWRLQNPEIKPDLREADLRGANLGGASLTRADLTWATLHVADLTRADLTWATLHVADLTRANLTRADLAGADFSVANLTRANLTWANLRDANLRAANLTRANLSRVSLSRTIFGDTNLTAGQGLETCDHKGPSILDHSTLAQSGPLPLAFLRGCGLPDALINCLPSLLNEPFQFYSCFISYAKGPRVRRPAVCRSAEQRGEVLVCPRRPENWRPHPSPH